MAETEPSSARTVAVLLLALLAVGLGCRRGARYSVPRDVVRATDVGTATTRFFAVGDGGTGAAEQYRVAATIAGKCRESGCDFGLLLGDNFYPSGVTSASDAQWQTKLEAPYAEIMAARIPLYPALGNHDYAESDDWDRALPQLARAHSQENWRMPERAYTFDSRHAAFVALDTTALGAGLEQAADYQSRLLTEASSRRKPWLIVFGHHTYRANGSNGDAKAEWARFFARRVCSVADLYLSGHDHNLQVLEAAPGCPPIRVVAGGGGFETHRLVGKNPALFQRETLGHAYVTAGPERLRVELVSAAGSTLFVHEIRR